MTRDIDKAALDRWITGNWGEDSVPDFYCPECGKKTKGEPICKEHGYYEQCLTCEKWELVNEDVAPTGEFYCTKCKRKEDG